MGPNRAGFVLPRSHKKVARTLWSMLYDQGADPPVGFLWPPGLGGIDTALRLCDSPRWTPDFLESLPEAAEHLGEDCLVPADGTGLEPLWAVYHRRALPVGGWEAERKNS